MKWHPPGFGGTRRDTEQVKRDGWQERGVLVIAEDDEGRWPEHDVAQRILSDVERLVGERQ